MKRRPLLPDFDLWTEVARSIKPLNRKRVSAAMEQQPASAPRSDKRPAEKPTQAPYHAVRSEPPLLTGLDRKSARRMTRGQVEIEARIDLHGTGIEQSRGRLLRFLHDKRADGARLVLVITGKGDSPFARHTLHGASHFHTPERQGRLRRHVPEWLHEAEFRALVAGFQPAHPRHGGGGAFYVKLRRRDRGSA